MQRADGLRISCAGRGPTVSRFPLVPNSGRTYVYLHAEGGKWGKAGLAMRGIQSVNNGNAGLVKRPAVAVVGLGYWGPNILRVLFERPGADVRWLCDCDPERLEYIGRRYPGVRLTTELGQVLEDPAVDGVLLATPV